MPPKVRTEFGRQGAVLDHIKHFKSELAKSMKQAFHDIRSLLKEFHPDFRTTDLRKTMDNIIKHVESSKITSKTDLLYASSSFQSVLDHVQSIVGQRLIDMSNSLKGISKDVKGSLQSVWDRTQATFNGLKTNLDSLRTRASSTFDSIYGTNLDKPLKDAPSWVSSESAKAQTYLSQADAAGQGIYKRMQDSHTLHSQAQSHAFSNANLDAATLHDGSVETKIGSTTVKGGDRFGKVSSDANSLASRARSNVGVEVGQHASELGKMDTANSARGYAGDAHSFYGTKSLDRSRVRSGEHGIGLEGQEWTSHQSELTAKQSGLSESGGRANTNASSHTQLRSLEDIAKAHVSEVDFRTRNEPKDPKLVQHAKEVRLANAFEKDVLSHPSDGVVDASRMNVQDVFKHQADIWTKLDNARGTRSAREAKSQMDNAWNQATFESKGYTSRATPHTKVGGYFGKGEGSIRQRGADVRGSWDKADANFRMKGEGVHASERTSARDASTLQGRLDGQVRDSIRDATREEKAIGKKEKSGALSRAEINAKTSATLRDRWGNDAKSNSNLLEGSSHTIADEAAKGSVQELSKYGVLLEEIGSDSVRRSGSDASGRFGDATTRGQLETRSHADSLRGDLGQFKTIGDSLRHELDSTRHGQLDAREGSSSLNDARGREAERTKVVSDVNGMREKQRSVMTNEMNARLMERQARIHDVQTRSELSRDGQVASSFMADVQGHMSLNKTITGWDHVSSVHSVQELGKYGKLLDDLSSIHNNVIGKESKGVFSDATRRGEIDGVNHGEMHPVTTRMWGEGKMKGRDNMGLDTLEGRNRMTEQRSFERKQLETRDEATSASNSQRTVVRDEMNARVRDKANRVHDRTTLSDYARQGDVAGAFEKDMLRRPEFVSEMIPSHVEGTVDSMNRYGQRLEDLHTQELRARDPSSFRSEASGRSTIDTMKSKMEVRPETRSMHGSRDMDRPTRSKWDEMEAEHQKGASDARAHDRTVVRDRASQLRTEEGSIRSKELDAHIKDFESRMNDVKERSNFRKESSIADAWSKDAKARQEILDKSSDWMKSADNLHVQELDALGKRMDEMSGLERRSNMGRASELRREGDFRSRSEVHPEVHGEVRDFHGTREMDRPGRSGWDEMESRGRGEDVRGRERLREEVKRRGEEVSGRDRDTLRKEGEGKGREEAARRQKGREDTHSSSERTASEWERDAKSRDGKGEGKRDFENESRYERELREREGEWERKSREERDNARDKDRKGREEERKGREDLEEKVYERRTNEERARDEGRDKKERKKEEVEREMEERNRERRRKMEEDEGRRKMEEERAREEKRRKEQEEKERKAREDENRRREEEEKAKRERLAKIIALLMGLGSGLGGSKGGGGSTGDGSSGGDGEGTPPGGTGGDTTTTPTKDTTTMLQTYGKYILVVLILLAALFFMGGGKNKEDV